MAALQNTKLTCDDADGFKNPQILENLSFNLSEVKSMDNDGKTISIRTYGEHPREQIIMLSRQFPNIQFTARFIFEDMAQNPVESFQVFQNGDIVRYSISPEDMLGKQKKIIPEATIELVRRAGKIVDVVEGHGVRLVKRGESYVGLCPFHNEKVPSFHVTPAKEMFYCFGCHEGGNVFTFIMKTQNITFREAVIYLSGRWNVPLHD